MSDSTTSASRTALFWRIRNWVAAVVYIGGAALLMALAPIQQDSAWSETGIAAGVVSIAIAIELCGRLALYAVREGRLWSSGVPFAVGGIVLLTYGVFAIVGNFRVSYEDVTVTAKETKIVGSTRTAHRVWLMSTVESGSWEVTEEVYASIRVGDRLRCSGPDGGVQRVDFTRCVGR